jgi:hypothetical protein
LAHRYWGDARDNFEHTCSIFEEIGMPNPAPVLNLGWVHLHEGAHDNAHAAFSRTLVAARRYHLRHEATYGVLGLARLAAAEQNYERAAALIGFADAELHRWGQSWPDPECSFREQALADITLNLRSRADTIYYSGWTAERAPRSLQAQEGPQIAIATSRRRPTQQSRSSGSLCLFRQT